MSDNTERIDIGAPFDDPHPNSDDYWADMVKITVLTVMVVVLWGVAVGAASLVNWIGGLL